MELNLLFYANIIRLHQRGFFLFVCFLGLCFFFLDEGCLPPLRARLHPVRWRWISRGPENAVLVAGRLFMSGGALVESGG